MESANNLLETDTYIINSISQISYTLESLKALQSDNIVIHLLSSSQTTLFVKNLNNEIVKHIPKAKVIFIKSDEDYKACLNVYTFEDCIENKPVNNFILSNLYQNNSNKESDITKYRDRLFNRYFTDHLTNLPNIYQLRRDLENNEDFSLIIFNIDNFQIINNFYGYVVGDYAIEQVATFIKKQANECNVYKISGDEFALVVNRGMFFYDLKEHLTKLYQKMKDIVINYQGTNIFINVTLASSANGNNENIFSKVSMALRYAKEVNAHFWIYEDKMGFEDNYERKLQLSEVVREAVSNFRVIPYYQAIIDTKTSKIKKYECLARLIDIDGKILSPLDFIPISKKIKNYDIVTKTIIDKSFATFETIDFEFTINLSIEDIINKEMFTFIMDKLKNSNVSHKVTFEILESDAIEDFKKVERFISEVKRYGAKIAIDDFGSGYSNFSYLTKMSADYIKIDGSLVKEIDQDRNSLLVVETIVEFAKKLGIKTIAEYVHSKIIMDKVKELGVDYSQGFYIDEPSELT